MNLRVIYDINLLLKIYLVPGIEIILFKWQEKWLSKYLLWSQVVTIMKLNFKILT